MKFIFPEKRWVYRATFDTMCENVTWRCDPERIPLWREFFKDAWDIMRDCWSWEDIKMLMGTDMRGNRLMDRKYWVLDGGITFPKGTSGVFWIDFITQQEVKVFRSEGGEGGKKEKLEKMVKYLS